MQASGVISKVKPRRTSAGTCYSFALRDQDGWYGTFRTTPPDEGTYVEFEFTKNKAGFLNVDLDTLVTAEAPEGAEESKAEDSGVSERAAAAEKRFSNKDTVIRWESARKAAVAIATGALNAGILDVAANASKGKQLEAYQIYVNQMTLEFFNHDCEIAETGEVPGDFQ